MTLVQELFAEYVFAERAGEGDPRPILERADAADREILGEMIDSYLAAAPGKAWDPKAFQDSAAQEMIEPLNRALCGVSGTWPVLLPSLRERSRLKRADLVEKLAGKLGFPDQRETVGEYYHGMEYGTVESSGVSGKVLDVLAEIFGTGGEALRKSGELIGGGGQSVGEVVFARAVTNESSDFVLSDPDEFPGESSAVDPQTSNADRDAVIDLFTGGQ